MCASSSRPQRRQKQKAQQRLGVYGPYLARGMFSQEEGEDDGDYRERLTAGEQRKRRAEAEAKEKEKEAKDKPEQAGDTRPSKKLKSSTSDDGSSPELDVEGLGRSRGVEWANSLLMPSSQSQEEDTLSPKPPSLDSLTLTPSSPPFAFNIVLPEFDESLISSSPTPKLRSAISRKLKKQDSSVSFAEVVTAIDRRGRTAQYPLKPANEEGMRCVDGASPPPPRRRNLRTRPSKPPVRLDLGLSDEDEEEDDKEPEEDDDDQDAYDESEQEEEGTNSQQLSRQMRAKEDRKRKQQQEEEEQENEENEEEQEKKRKGRAIRGRNGGVAANGKGKAKALPDKKIKRAPGRPRKNAITVTKTAALFHRACLKHLVPKDHCEVPERLSTTIECIEQLREAEEMRIELFDSPSKADLRWVKAVHDASYIRKMSEKVPSLVGSQAIMHATQTTLEMENSDGNFFTDTFMSSESWAAALYAAGSVIEAVDLVMGKSYRNAICAVRPPGHHCGRSGRTGDVKSQGFCLLNNVAIGAKYALLKHDIERIAIVDFDVHAGNGTEEIFTDDDNFLFVSIHAVGESFYPETGLHSNGNVFNLPLPHRTTAAAYRKEFEKVIHKLDAFAPQFLFLSSGFDGHRSDPIRGPKKKEGFALTGADYHHITTQLLKVAERHCGDKVVSVLEGGYDVGPRTQGLAESFKAHVMALMGCSEEDIMAQPRRAAAAATKRLARRSAPTARTSTASAVQGRTRTKAKAKAKPISSSESSEDEEEDQKPVPPTTASPRRPPASSPAGPSGTAQIAAQSLPTPSTRSPSSSPSAPSTPSPPSSQVVSRAIRISPVLGRPKPLQFPPSGSPKPAKRKAVSQEVNIIDDDSDDQKADQRKSIQRESVGGNQGADIKNEKANGASEVRRPVRRTAKRTLRSMHGSNGSGSIGSSQGDEEAKPVTKPKTEGGATRRWARRVASSTQSEEEYSSAPFIIQPDRMEEDSQQSSQPSQSSQSSAASKQTPSPSSSQQQSLSEQTPASFGDDDSDESDPLFLSFRESLPRGTVVLDLSQQPDEDDEETQLGP